MAKKPTPMPTPAPTGEGGAAPSQPWAPKPAAAAPTAQNPTSDAPAASTTPAPATPKENPPESQADATAPASDTDVKTPEADAADANEAGKAAEPVAKPLPEDERASLAELVRDLSDEEREEFEGAVEAAAKAKLDQIIKRRKAVEIEANFVEDHAHFGNRFYQKPKA